MATTEEYINWLEEHKDDIESISEPVQEDDKWVYIIQMKKKPWVSFKEWQALKGRSIELVKKKEDDEK